MQFRVKEKKQFVGYNSYSRSVSGKRGRFRASYRETVTVPILYDQDVDSTRSVSMLCIVFIILALFAFVSAVTGRSNVFTFSGLLQSFADCPSIPLPAVVNFMDNLYIYDDWTRLGNWLRDFINNFLLPFISVIVYFCTAISQLVLYIIWFLKILFVGV